MSIRHTAIQHLARLRALAPDRDFSARSRALILASDRKTPAAAALPQHRATTIIVRTALFVAGSAVVLVGLFYGSRYFSPVFLPGLNHDSIVAEADAIDNTITIQLSQLQYFDTASQASAHALSQVAAPTLNHLNSAVISSDSEKIQTLTPTNTDQTSQNITDILKALQE